MSRGSLYTGPYESSTCCFTRISMGLYCDFIMIGSWHAAKQIVFLRSCFPSSNDWLIFTKSFVAHCQVLDEPRLKIPESFSMTTNGSPTGRDLVELVLTLVKCTQTIGHPYFVSFFATYAVHVRVRVLKQCRSRYTFACSYIWYCRL